MSGLSSLKSLYPLTVMQSDPVFAVVPCPDISTVTLGVLGNFSLTAQRHTVLPFPPGCSAMLMPYSLTTIANSWGRFPPENSYRPSLARGSGKPQHPAVLGLVFHRPGQGFPYSWQKATPFTATEAISPAAPHPYGPGYP